MLLSHPLREEGFKVAFMNEVFAEVCIVSLTVYAVRTSRDKVVQQGIGTSVIVFHVFEYAFI